MMGRNVCRLNRCAAKLATAFLATTIVFGLLVVDASAAIVVNGNLSDWGVTVADNDASSWGVPAGTGTNTVGTFTYFYHQEDQSDTSGDSYFLGPNYGGQNY